MKKMETENGKRKGDNYKTKVCLTDVEVAVVLSSCYKSGQEFMMPDTDKAFHRLIRKLQKALHRAVNPKVV